MTLLGLLILVGGGLIVYWAWTAVSGGTGSSSTPAPPGPAGGSGHGTGGTVAQ